MSMAFELWHKLISLSWAAWIAAAALMVGLGAFLDEYYVGDGARQKTRERVSALLQRLEHPRDSARDWFEAFRMTAPLLLWGLLPAGVCLMGRLAPNGSSLGASLFGIALVLLLMYSLALVPFFLAILLMVLFTVAMLTFRLLQATLHAVFSPASDPKKSPFKFATSMMGLWILIAKLILEIAK